MNKLENPDIKAALKRFEADSTKLAEAIMRREDDELTTLFGIFLESFSGVNQQILTKIETNDVIRKARGEKT